MKTLTKIALALCPVIIFAGCSRRVEPVNFADRYPQIFPDYIDVTVPPNIAPLNFMITEEGIESVQMKCIPKNGKHLTVNSKNKIRFPERSWKKILHDNTNDTITIEIIVKRSGQRIKFRPFNMFVAPDPIDGYLAYRLIEPGYVIWNQMGIYQRNLETFREIPLITNRLTNGNCMNCHSFCGNDPDIMLFHMREKMSGTIIWHHARLRKLDTGSKQTISHGVYPSWHPSGKWVAFSTNLTRQNFHAVKDKKVEVWDAQSDIVLVDTEENRLLADSLLMSKRHFETFPTWSPDGLSLYFCSADSLPMPDQYDRLQYSLLRIDFDPLKPSFGNQIDTIVSARKTGKSVSFPRVSPDGKFILFTMSAYGNFSIWHRDADLYLYHFEKDEIIRLTEVNSDESESYHSWSSNGRWFVFSSRRIDGLYTRLYFTWGDHNGKFTKPFLLPQKDPEHNIRLMKSYNVPELIRGKINLSPHRIAKKARQQGEKLK